MHSFQWNWGRRQCACLHPPRDRTRSLEPPFQQRVTRLRDITASRASSRSVCLCHRCSVTCGPLIVCSQHQLRCHLAEGHHHIVRSYCTQEQKGSSPGSTMLEDEGPYAHQTLFSIEYACGSCISLFCLTDSPTAPGWYVSRHRPLPNAVKRNLSSPKLLQIHLLGR